MRSQLTIALSTVVCLLTAANALGHEGPEEEISELTEQIRLQGPSSNLLLQRAVEYNILGKYAEAAKDLERALDLEPDSVNAQRELSQAYYSLGKTNEALATVNRALKGPMDPANQAALRMVRSGMLRARKEYLKALNDANEAIHQYPINAEWYLSRSQLQALLKLRPERIQGLEDGIRETGSGLLAAEHVEALIDGGRNQDALIPIERELQRGRWRSSWLIRRAKVRLALDQTTAAENDLTAALQELNHRLAGKAPDALLLADRGLVYDLLQKKEQARADYRAARDKGLSDEWVLERIRALRTSAQDDD